MSDYPNGRPPGQNNLDATAQPYVKPENDPSATAPKADDQRAKEDGVEVREDTKPEVVQQLDEARGNMVDPSTAEQPQPEEKKPEPEQKSNARR